MINKEKLALAAAVAFLALVANTALAADTTEKTERCYGVVKAGKNDCATKTNSCAGSSTKDRQADAFVFVPKGLCEKLVGGHLK